MNWLAHVLGLDNSSGAYYLFWSGFAGDLIYIGAIAAFYRRLNCHVKGCWRIGLHKVEKTPYTTCRKHHPTAKKLNAQEMVDYQRHILRKKK